MTSATPAAAIEDRLRANWMTTPVELFNETTEPPKGSDGTPIPWVALEFPGGVGTVWGIGNPGNNSFREDGAFMIHVFVPAGSGSTLARTYADQLAAIFRGKDFATSVVCYAPHPPQTNGTPDGNYFGVSFAV